MISAHVLTHLLSPTASKLNDIRSLEFVDKYKEDVVIPDDTGISHKSSGDTKTSDETEVNSVGSLQTVCMKNHWRPPEYKTTDTIGPPHDRSFTVSCEVYPEGIKILKQGSGKSLRVAKRNAAMEILNQMVSNGTIDTIGVNTDKTDKESPENESMDDYSSPVSVYSGQPVLDLLQDINLDDENVKSDRDWVKILTDAAPGLKASLEILDMPNKNDSDNLFRVLIKLNPLNVENTHQPTIPLMTSWGVGTTRDNAIRDAAARSIQLLNM